MTARYLMATCLSASIALMLLVLGGFVLAGGWMRPSAETASHLSHPNDLFVRAMAFGNLAACPTEIRNGKIRYGFSGQLEKYEGSFDASPTDVDKWIRLSPSIQGGQTTALPDGSTQYRLVCPHFIEGTVILSQDHTHVAFEVNSYT